MILWMAQKDEKENIQEVVYALSDYYKLILNKGEDFVPLMDELRLCEMYAAIQQKRFKGKIRFEIEVEAEAEACLLPKITLQPLVENAIIHGVLENRSGRADSHKRQRPQRRLQLSVSDDGPGMRRKSPILSGIGERLRADNIKSGWSTISTNQTGFICIRYKDGYYRKHRCPGHHGGLEFLPAFRIGLKHGWNRHAFGYLALLNV